MSLHHPIRGMRPYCYHSYGQFGRIRLQSPPRELHTPNVARPEKRHTSVPADLCMVSAGHTRWSTATRPTGSVDPVNAEGKPLSSGGPKLHTFLASVPASRLWLARQSCGLGGVV